MQSVIRYASFVVVIHLLVVILHGLAHAQIPVPLSSFHQLFVVSMIVFAPIVAMILLWTPLQQLGSWLLLGSMAGAFLFGLYYHFILVSPDHVSQISFAGWGILFHITAVLLFLIEGIGWGIGIWAINTLQSKKCCEPY